MRNLKVLILKPMQGCEVGDVFFPSEYFMKTESAHPDRWKFATEEEIKEARRHGRDIDFIFELAERKGIEDVMTFWNEIRKNGCSEVE